MNEKLPPRLLKVVEKVRDNLIPPPPKFRVVIDKKAPTFSASYVEKKITVPTFWEEFKERHLKSFLGHEYKHVSIDGYPCSYIEDIRNRAALMSYLKNQKMKVTANNVQRVLNAVYDAVINTRLQEQGFDMKSTMEVWLKKFPIDKESEGTIYHLLQILHKYLFGVQIPPTDYETQIVDGHIFKELLKDIKELVREGDQMREKKNTGLVVEAGYNFLWLIYPNIDDERNEGECSNGDEPAPEDQREKIAEIALQAGLDANELKDLLNDPKISIDEAKRLLEEATKNLARTMIWKSVLAFEDKGSLDGRDINEPYRRKWKGYDISKLDPLSVVLHKNEPQKWKEKIKRPFLTINQPSSSNRGFNEVIILLDRSSSTQAMYDGREVFSYEKDTAIYTVGFAKKENIPVSLIWFANDAKLEAAGSKNYLSVAETIITMKSTNEGTNLRSAIDKCIGLYPEHALVVIITDGEVNRGHFNSILQISKENKIMCAVVNFNITSNILVEEAGGKATIIHVKPDQAGKTMLALLKKSSS